MQDTVLTKEYGEFQAKAQIFTEWYIGHCVDESSYQKAGEIMVQQREELGITPGHLKKRGRQHKYAEMVTHDRKFIRCSGLNCGKWFCTDPWLPYGYSQVNSRIMWVGGKKAYFCLAKCYSSL
jgi:hypothetical protein